MLKVLVLLEAADIGGPAKNLLATLAILKQHAQFTILTYLRSSQTTSAFIMYAEQIGLKVHVLQEKFRYDARAALQLRSLIHAAQPDLIQIHNTKSRLFVMLLQRSRNIPDIPRIDFFHGETWVNAKQHLYNYLDRLLLKRSRHIVVVSEFQSRLLASWGIPRERITVIPNAIPIRPAAPKPVSDFKTILSIGRLSREKGHITLVQAVDDLARQGERGFRLVLVGDGPERQRIVDYVQRHQLEDWVRFEGYQADTQAYYRQADLFVLPSYSEGFPNVLLEAALFLVPMVSTAVGGVSDAFVDGQEIALVREHGRDALANQLRDFLREPDKYAELAQRARKRVEEDYNIEKKSQRLLDYYNSIVTSASS